MPKNHNPSFPMQNPSAFWDTFLQQLPATLAKLQDLDVESLARQSGFLERSPRKIPILKFVEGLLAVAPESDLTLERIASVIALAAGTTYSKQALGERLSHDIEPFLGRVITALFGQLSQSVRTSQAFESFGRVLVQDSTVENLPKHLAQMFPGAGNQHGGDYAALKIQWICDLKNSAVARVSLSGFTRNDQAAAPDILQVAHPGDLVIRDLGYLTSQVLAQLGQALIFFLTRYKHGINLYEPHSQKLLDLKAQLRTYGRLDRPVLLGPERVLTRLVALPVPQEVANLRRHRAKTSALRRHRSAPSAAHLFLMGWNIFLTNVPVKVWPPKTLAAVYRLRWRIEIVFKTWKSHLGLRQLNCRTVVLLQLSVLTKLLFCEMVCQICDALELNCTADEHVSLLRVGHVLGQCACWFSAAMLGISVAQWLKFCLTRHSLYEKRNDRRNYYQLLSQAGEALA
jgi:hypothetical protein